jgi:D-amino peptidase
VKVYLMTDMEGVCGVRDHDGWVVPSGAFYAEGRGLTTLEANAAVEGFLEAGAEEVVVADGHGAGGIEPGLLDPRAKLVRPKGYPFGLSGDLGAMAWIGQHAKAGSLRAHLPHTGWFDVIDDSIDGVSVGEFGQMALLGGEMGVRPIFASGDRALCAEARAFAPGIATVEVKAGRNETSGDELNAQAYRAHALGCEALEPEEARRRIREGAREAMERFLKDPSSFAMPRLEAPHVRVKRHRADDAKQAWTGRSAPCATILETLTAGLEKT